MDSPECIIEKVEHPLINIINADVEHLNTIITENRDMSSDFITRKFADSARGLSPDSFYSNCIAKSGALFLTTIRSMHDVVNNHIHIYY
jgi:hypothetical protein